jgi:uncharacterized membrane protein
MLTLPPIPSWQAIHPLVVHFPIALLLIAPVFIVIGVALKPERSFPFLLTALILMTFGTVSTFVAASSGEGAGELVGNAAQAKAVLEQHEELAEITEIAFSALTLIFASILFVPRLLKREPTRAISTILPLVFLIFYATGAVTLANTAHQGGRLVHELGIRAQMQPGGAASRSGDID